MLDQYVPDGLYPVERTLARTDFERTAAHGKDLMPQH